MLIVLIICAVFAEPHRWTILKLCNWGLKIIYDLRALARYLKIRRHEFSANRWQSMKFATTSVWLSIDHRLADANRCQLTIINRLSSIDRLVFRSSIFIDCLGPGICLANERYFHIKSFSGERFLPFTFPWQGLFNPSAGFVIPKRGSIFPITGFSFPKRARRKMILSAPSIFNFEAPFETFHSTGLTHTSKAVAYWENTS